MLETATPLDRLTGETVLVTGAAGSIGHHVCQLLADAAIRHVATDIDTLDVRRPVGNLSPAPTVILHLAAAKHAPEGELDPAATVAVNVTGTRNVLDYAARVGARVVTASTCKAADPETVYGASKLIAERMTLNAGGTVARFFNVRESSGNVFEIWAAVPAAEPLPVAPCWRYFITLDDAAALMLWAAVLPPGRYTAAPGGPQRIRDVAADLYPGRPHVHIDPRRGDRIREPHHAASEHAKHVAAAPGILKIVSPHDPAHIPALAVAA